MIRILFLVCFVSTSVFGQNRYLTKTGEVNFEASVPSFEEVAATNKSCTAILDLDNGEFAALVLIKGFRFKNALMEEHFNENYAESNKYPKATFKGTINGFDKNKVSSNPESFMINGSLEFHGETHIYDEIWFQLHKTADGIMMTGSFKADVSDFNIDIPKVVRNKVSNEVNVNFNFNLKKQ